MSEAKTFNATFNSITEILELVSECGSIEDLKDYTAELVSLGKDLDALYQETTAEITELKEKNKELEDENAKLKEENRKLKAYIKSMSAGDCKISTAACKKDYEQYWELLEEDSQKFLVTSYFVLRRIKGTNADFSAVVISLCKPYETEIRRKIFLPFIIEQSKLPILEKDGGYLRTAVEDYKNGKDVFMLFKIMILSLRKPKFPVSYEQRLHAELYKNKWNLKVFESKEFTTESIDYMEKYRNHAAHINFVEEQFAIDCKITTKKMLFKLISTYPKSK